MWTAARNAKLVEALRRPRGGKARDWRVLAKDFGLSECALRTAASKLNWTAERREHERQRQREYRRQQRLETLGIEAKAAALSGYTRTGRITKLERAREYRRLEREEAKAKRERLISLARLSAPGGRYTKLERAGQVTVDREQEWLAMATRNARVLYEVALLRSANPTHALMGYTPPG